jgi:hypothetical protein
VDALSDGSNVQAFVTDEGSGLNAKVESSGDGLSPAEVGLVTTARLSGYNGATWDRLRSDLANGLDVDVTRSALPDGAATEATLATRATEATLAAVLTELAAISGQLSGLATETTLGEALDRLEELVSSARGRSQLLALLSSEVTGSDLSQLEEDDS